MCAALPDLCLMCQLPLEQTESSKRTRQKGQIKESKLVKRERPYASQDHLCHYCRLCLPLHLQPSCYHCALPVETALITSKDDHLAGQLPLSTARSLRPTSSFTSSLPSSLPSFLPSSLAAYASLSASSSFLPPPYPSPSATVQQSEAADARNHSATTLDFDFGPFDHPPSNSRTSASSRAVSQDRLICASCRTAPLSDFAVAALEYTDLTRYLMQRFKFHQGRRERDALAMVLHRTIERRYQNSPKPQLLLPMPQAWRRGLVRGFNQAGVLAQFLSRSQSIPVRHNCLRKRHRAPQQSLRRKQRLALPANTFALSEQGRRLLSTYTHVAVVDDVLTTGASARQLIKVLRAAGVREIDLWCVARATQDTAGR